MGHTLDRAEVSARPLGCHAQSHRLRSRSRWLHGAPGDFDLGQHYEDYYGLEAAGDEQVDEAADAAATPARGILPTVFEADAEDDGGEWQSAGRHGAKAAWVTSHASEVDCPPGISNVVRVPVTSGSTEVNA